MQICLIILCTQTFATEQKCNEKMSLGSYLRQQQQHQQQIKQELTVAFLQCVIAIFQFGFPIDDCWPLCDVSAIQSIQITKKKKNFYVCHLFVNDRLFQCAVTLENRDFCLHSTFIDLMDFFFKLNAIIVVYTF